MIGGGGGGVVTGGTREGGGVGGVAGSCRQWEGRDAAARGNDDGF